MKCNVQLINIAAVICLVNLAGIAHAEVAVSPALPSTAAIHTQAYTPNAYTRNSKSYLLALNENNVMVGRDSSGTSVGTTNPATTDSAARATEFEPPLLSGSNAHKYMGLATVALVGLTALTAPEEDEGAATSTTSRTTGTHQSLGRLTAALAAATVTSGLLTHWDDFHLEDGFTDPDNLHVMLGAAGALAMMYAVSKAPGNGHPGIGMAGGIAMGAAIKLTW